MKRNVIYLRPEAPQEGVADAPLRVDAKVADLIAVPRAALSAAATEVGLARELRQVFYDWPDVERVMVRIAESVGSAHPGIDGFSLLGEAVRDGVAAYRQSRAEPQTRTHPMSAFVHAAIMRTAESLALWECHATVALGHVRWQPLGSPFVTWAQSTGAESIVFTRPLEADEFMRSGAPMFVASQVLEITDWGHLKANGYRLEQA